MAVPGDQFLMMLNYRRVADREQGARCIDRQVERRAGAQILVVEVSGVDAGWRTADATHGGQRRDTHGAEEWSRQLDYDTGRDFGGFSFAIDWDDTLEKAREFLG